MGRRDARQQPIRIVIDAPEWVTRLSVAGLTVLDQGALMCLLVQASVNQGYLLERTTNALALASGLGDSWAESKLCKSLALWFRPTDDGRLESIDLAAERERHQAWSLAGQKGMAKRWKHKVVITTLLPPYNHLTPEGSSGEQNVVSTAHKPMAETHLQPEACVGPEESVSEADEHSAADPQCNGLRPANERCFVSGSSGDNIGIIQPETVSDGGTSSIQSPLLPPYIQDPFSSEGEECRGEGGIELPADVETAFLAIRPAKGATEFQRQVMECLIGLGFRCEGERPVGLLYLDVYAIRDNFYLAIELDRLTPRLKSLGKLRQMQGCYRLVMLREASGTLDAPYGIHRVMGLAKTDLFGVPIEEPKHHAKPIKPAKIIMDQAVEIADAYQLEVEPDHRRTSRSDKNVAYWLAHGYEVEQLRAAIRHYAEFCDAAGRSGEFRKSCLNFFSRRDPLFKSYLKKGEIRERKKPVGAGGRVRAPEGTDLNAGSVKVFLDQTPIDSVPKTRATSSQGSGGGSPQPKRADWPFG